MLSSKIENRARMPSLTPVFNMILEILVIAIKHEKKQNKQTNKQKSSIQIEKKEEKLPLFSDDMNLYEIS